MDIVYFCLLILNIFNVLIQSKSFLTCNTCYYYYNVLIYNYISIHFYDVADTALFTIDYAIRSYNIMTTNTAGILLLKLFKVLIVTNNGNIKRCTSCLNKI